MSILKEKIIIPARDIIKNDSKIKLFYFIPWLLSIIFLSVLLVYQSIYTYVKIFWKKEEALEIILQFFHSDYVVEVIISLVIFLIAYFLLTPIFEWWLIKYIASKNKDNMFSMSEFISLGLYKFLPIFEYNNIFSEFKFISILNMYLFTIRFVGVEYIRYISYMFLVVMIFGTIINVLFSYAKYEIVLRDKWIFESVGISSKIAIFNLKTTIKLHILIFFLNIKVIINFIIFLSFPIIIIIAISYITSKIFLFISITILSLLFIFFILLLWYLAAVLEIFVRSIWYFAYIEWENQMKRIRDI
jgi:hypothetical protein